MNDDPAKAKRQAMMVARGVVSPDERQENLSAFQKGNHPDVPSVVYHGTADDISQFQHNHPNKKDAGWLGKGFYFTNNKSLANSYSMLKTGLSENVMPVHLSLKNPFIATMGHKNAIKQKLFSGDQFAPSDFTNDLISRGHDGVILDYGDKDNAKEYVVFHPTQIKSAIGNQGTFDPNDPDITKARGGMIDDSDKAIRRATMVAKGLAKEIGPLPTGDHPKPPHPASMIPGVHVTGMDDGPQTFADGGDVEPTDETGFDAYHGSPHEFAPERLIQHPTGEQEYIPTSQPVPENASVLKELPLGRFRSDKIGTGEGAQAFGHGLYFGEEPTARSYRDALSGEPVTNEGKKPNWQNKGSKYFAQTSLAQSLGKKMSGDVAIKDAIQDLHRNAAFSERKDIKQRYYDAANSLDEMLGKQWKIDPGHIYHVRVNANPEHFLDWDKPLSEQHPHVKRALGYRSEHELSDLEDRINKLINAGAVEDFDPEHGFSGAPPRAPHLVPELHQLLNERAVANEFNGRKSVEKLVNEAPDRASASAALLAAGIPGIRYLDANSRDPNTGNPTHNHVVFDPSKITIKRRYARGGVVKKFAGGGDTGAGMNNDPMVQKALDGGSIVDRALTVARNAIKR